MILKKDNWVPGVSVAGLRDNRRRDRDSLVLLRLTSYLKQNKFITFLNVYEMDMMIPTL